MNETHILWTGGWDSTYRVIEACRAGASVRPHYVIDPGRASHPREIMTMALLAQEIRARWPAAALAPPTLTFLDDIPADAVISAAFRKLRPINKLGDQYDWLPRFATRFDEIELCIHQHDKAARFIAALAVRPDGDPCWSVPDDGRDAGRLFSRFLFPLLGMTKLDMEARAKEAGFLDLLDRTWFCFEPTADGAPCGMCNPCRYTREEGLARRVPAPPTPRPRFWSAFAQTMIGRTLKVR